jgi:hypothetical protein
MSGLCSGNSGSFQIQVGGGYIAFMLNEGRDSRVQSQTDLTSVVGV